MSTTLKLKIVSIVIVMLVSIHAIVGIPRSTNELRANLRNNIRLGADLQGGSHLTLQVQVQDAFNTEAQAEATRLREELNKAALDVAVEVVEAKQISDAEQAAIRVSFGESTPIAKIRAFLSEQPARWVLSPASASEYRLTLNPAEAARLRQDVMNQTLHVIEKKINDLGLTEATAQLVGDSRDAEILVEMPGVDDPPRIKRILATASVLEWLDVKDGPYATAEAALVAYGGIRPLNTELLEWGTGWYLLSRNPVIRGTDIRDARASQRPTGGWVTIFVLSQDAAKRFEPYTEAHIGSRAAIVLDRKIVSVATIQNKIRDTGEITGEASQQDASDLALNLRAGSLPAGIQFLEERTVGPSLGADSIREGMYAGGAGLAAVVTAMCVYYRGSGVNATVALLLNALLLVAALSYAGGVLTLPGIAGMILTIGMAVDSNVLIFERIREELREGKAVAAAVAAGFRKALVTIIDTHVTTVVACSCLFLFGTGPVKGFAVTLVLGLVANVFTSVFVSRTLFDWRLERSMDPRISI
jgi:preprotein translocase subunit SecD